MEPDSLLRQPRPRPEPEPESDFSATLRSALTHFATHVARDEEAIDAVRDYPKDYPTLRSALLAQSRDGKLPSVAKLKYKLRAMNNTPMNRMRLRARKRNTRLRAT